MDEVRVVKALGWGSARARKVAELAREVGLKGRLLQDVVDHLVLKHGVPIGSSMSKPFGNYLIESAEDLESTVHLYTRRGLHSLAKASGLRRQSLARYMSHVQTHLDLYTEDAWR